MKPTLLNALLRMDWYLTQRVETAETAERVWGNMHRLITSIAPNARLLRMDEGRVWLHHTPTSKVILVTYSASYPIPGEADSLVRGAFTFDYASTVPWGRGNPDKDGALADTYRSILDREVKIKWDAASEKLNAPGL